MMITLADTARLMLSKDHKARFLAEYYKKVDIGELEEEGEADA